MDNDLNAEKDYIPLSIITVSLLILAGGVILCGMGVAHGAIEVTLCGCAFIIYSGILLLTIVMLATFSGKVCEKGKI